MTMSYTKTHLNGYLIRSYYLSPKESDVTLVVDGHPLNGHKFVLSSKSDVFKTMFFGDFKESNDSEVTINGQTLSAFKLMLKYMYCEELESDDWEDSPLSDVMEVFRLAHIYHLRHLCITCELKIVGLMSVHNFFDIYKFGSFYRRKRIVVFVHKFAKRCAKEMIESEEFLTMGSMRREMKWMLNPRRQLDAIVALDRFLKKNDNWKVRFDAKNVETYPLE